MKNYIFIFLLFFSINTFGQTKPTEVSKGDKVVKKALYSKEEKESTRKNFRKEIETIGMSPDVKTKYTAIVEKHIARITTANKDRKMTKSQATDYVNRVIKEQNQEIEAILTSEQYKKHKLIMNRYQNSILYRIQAQK